MHKMNYIRNIILYCDKFIKYIHMITKYGVYSLSNISTDWTHIYRNE